ncbi:MAG TPA: toxin-antitoxin system YwqK family antitoxin, partial [Kofleriaceae bacterium]|nr:toxin-antitoxin system YwqK family antitoxin [Kofleriaceae bacterium]
DGGKLIGDPPPAGRNVYCVGADGAVHGPSASFGDDGHLIEIGANDHGKHEGLWTTYQAPGKKMYEASFHRGNLHGTATRWHPTGAKAEVGNYRDGRPDGTFHVYSTAGVELGTFTMRDGNGTYKAWHDTGELEFSQPMVNGQAHGTTTYWHKNGKKSEEGEYLRGNRTGRWHRWDEQGRVRSEGEYRADNMEGPWTFYDDQGRIERVDSYHRSMMFESVRYQDGQPLGHPPMGPYACSTDDGVRAAYGKATGRTLGKEWGCIERAEHFPGVIHIGSFAYDRGCEPTDIMVDCKITKLSDKDALARAGWAKARQDLRNSIALDYVKEIALVWAGSISDQPAAPAATPAPGGGVTVDLWTADPSGMKRGVTRRHRQYIIAADGTVTFKQLEVVDSGD